MSKNIPELTIIVQSTDSFSDCWEPFFILFVRYWPSFPHLILLNTETKSYQYKGLSIQCTKTQKLFGNRWPTWSETLLACLNMAPTEIVLLMLDDFFISGPVDSGALYHYLGLMHEQAYANITLTEHGHKRPAIPTQDPSILHVTQRARYRVTTSPALWQKKALMKYLRPDESAWEFEIFGSRRAWREPDTFFIANPSFLQNGTEGVIPYFQDIYDTGIVKGKWQPKIPQFFESNGIHLDYSQRGFYRSPPAILKKYEILKVLIKHPLRSARRLMGV